MYSQSLDRPQDEGHRGTGLALLYVNNPLPADADLGCQVFLVETELHPRVAYDGSQIDWRSNPHATSQNVSVRRHCSNVSDRRQAQKSAIGDTTECQRSLT